MHTGDKCFMNNNLYIFFNTQKEGKGLKDLER